MDVACNYERTQFNPGFWNDSAHISKNNCYNYAINRRTDSFAQPGRACGQQASTWACDAVTNAALCDGAHRRYNCFPDTEKNRNLCSPGHLAGSRIIIGIVCTQRDSGAINLEGRRQENTDNCNQVIKNPQTCCRGPYTQFCGYFYTCKSMRIR